MPASHTNGELFVFAGIQPTELRRQKAVQSLARRAQEPEHLPYERLLSSLGGQLRQLKSTHPFVPGVLKLLNNLTHSGISVAKLGEYRWTMEVGRKCPTTPYIY